MRNKSMAVIAAVATIMLLFPRNDAKAGPTNVTYYTVKYACIISPDARGMIVGEWTVDCAGNWSGWGWRPGDNCTYTETTYGDACSSGGGGGPDPGPGGPKKP